jgi:putative heme-binding domain-containing protein
VKLRSKTALFVCCALCIIPAAVFGQTDVPSDGRQVTTFTKVISPAGLAVSPTGEVFVSSDGNGAIKTVENIGNIFRYVDTDNDGVADKTTTFVGKFNSPRGMCFVDGTLYVVHPPFLSAFRDEDGDGVAEIKKTLVTSLGFDYKYRGADHSSNDVRMGIDGWLYLAIGDYGLPGATGTDGKQVFHRGGCVARVRPDGTEFEIFADGTRNIYDVAVDPYLNAFTRDNTNDGGRWNVRLNHITSMAHFGYPSLYMNFKNEIMKPLADFGGGSGTAALYLHEPGFPDHVSDTLLTGDHVKNQGAVFSHPLSPNGASFKLGPKQGQILNVQQITDMDVDGSSRLFASSWKNSNVVRLSYPSLKAATFPDLKKARDTALLEHVIARSQVCRLNAQREILNRGPKQVFVEGLTKIAAGDDPLYARVAALFTLKQLDGEESHETLIKLAAKDDLREFALRALADRKTQLKGVPTKLFVEALEDSNPRVRLQALIGLARLNQANAAAAVMPLLTDNDPVVAHTAVRTLVALKAVEPCLEVMATGSSSPTVEAVVQVLERLHDERVVDELIGLYAKHRDATYRGQVLRILFRLYYREAPWEWQDTTKGKWWWSIKPDTRGPYYARETWSQSDKIGKFLKQEFLREDDMAILKTFMVQFGINRLYMEGTLDKAVTVGEENSDLQISTADFVVSTQDYTSASVKFVARVAQSIPYTENSIVQGIYGSYLLDHEEGIKLGMDLVFANANSKKPGYRLSKAYSAFLRYGKDVQSKDVSYLIQKASAESSKSRVLAYKGLLWWAVREENIRDDVKQQAKEFVDAALQDESQAELILEALINASRGTPWWPWWKPYIGFVVKHLDSKDKSVRLVAEKAANAKYIRKQMPKQKPDTRMTIAKLQPKLSYAQLVAKISSTKGDATKGKLLFTRNNCANCHTTAKNETPKGPPLVIVSNKFDQKHILESILKPSAKIKQGYETTLFVMSNGKTVKGFIVNTGAEVIELRDEKGMPLKIKVKDIDERKTLTTSMMPEGVIKDLTIEEFASLLAYLKTLK